MAEDVIKTMDQAVKAISNREGKYLTFTLAEVALIKGICFAPKRSNYLGLCSTAQIEPTMPF